MSRPIGSKNKIGAQVKENIVAVFTRLGGTPAMATWAEANRSEFYRMYARLAPAELDVTAQVIDVSILTDGELAEVIASGSSARVAIEAESQGEPSGLH